MPPRIAVRDIAFFERPVRFVRPFRFGAVVINAASQAFVRVEIEVEGKGVAVGASAELLAPKWFDKRAELSPGQTVAELRRSLEIARGLYLAVREFQTAFGLHARCIEAQVAACAAENIPPLAAAYGPAEIDKAMLDALLRCCEVNFFDGMAANIAGIDASLTRDLRHEDISQFLRRCRRPRAGRGAAYRRPGRPDRRARAVWPTQPQNAGARYFKLKLNGDAEHDTARLIRIGQELSTLSDDYRVTLDANEQYADLAALRALIERLDRDSAIAPIAGKLLYIEQPMPREISADRRSARLRAATSSSTRPMIPMTRFRRRARSAIAAFRRNPARASTSRSSTRRAPPNGARKAKISSSPART